MHTLRLRLKTTEHDRHELNRRFHAVSHVHNVMAKHAMKLLGRVRHDEGYQAAKKEYGAILKKEDALSSGNKKKKFPKADVARKAELSAYMGRYLSDLGLTKSGFDSYIKVSGQQFKKLLSSQQVQKEAERVWKGCEAVLFGEGKEIHFKKFRDFNTICGKSNRNGAKFSKEGMCVDWLGLNMKCIVPEGDMYIAEALCDDISYCEIVRKMFPNGWHYYANLYLKGDAPRKIKDAGHGIVTGIDIGTSTLAAVSDDKAVLEELAPKCKEYNKRIRKLLRSLDTSKRIMNPDKYLPDGTIDKKNHDRWNLSNAYLKKRDLLKTLYRQKAEYIKQSHEIMANSLIKSSVNFIAEEMSFRGLQKRKRDTERQDRQSPVTGKDGTVKQVYKYKRKKRFGESLNNRAPAQFMTILEQKAKLYGGGLYKVATRSYRASQYDHAEDTYTKHSLGERERTVGGRTVQRDLYSAFLLKNSDAGLTKPDRDKCIYEFGRFMEMHDGLIDSMKKNNISMKQCFGF